MEDGTRIGTAINGGDGNAKLADLVPNVEFSGAEGGPLE